MHQRDEDHRIQDPGPTAALHSAALLTLARDQDPGLTLILPVDPVHAPMAGLIPARLILDAMGAATDDHGPVPGQGLMGTVVLAHRGLLIPTGQEAGREQKEQDPTGHGLAPLAPAPFQALELVLDLVLDPVLVLALATALAPAPALDPVASVPAALVKESRLLGSSHRIN